MIQILINYCKLRLELTLALCLTTSQSGLVTRVPEFEIVSADSLLGILTAR